TLSLCNAKCFGFLSPRSVSSPTLPSPSGGPSLPRFPAAWPPGGSLTAPTGSDALFRLAAHARSRYRIYSPRLNTQPVEEACVLVFSWLYCFASLHFLEPLPRARRLLPPRLRPPRGTSLLNPQSASPNTSSLPNSSRKQRLLAQFVSLSVSSAFSFPFSLS